MPALTRRRALTAGAAVAATAGLHTRAVAAPHTAPVPTPASASASAHEQDHAHGHDLPEAFDEVFRGRRIQGRPTCGHHHGTGYAVFVDGAELHVMRNADGSWISVVGHYAPVPSPRDAARAAVEELRGASLVPFD
ncbi:apotyrosinase chaperone MelC1 [Streptomyces lannensis]|uniref:apotyrosinase chaperone MelC1 n=1 Tax=Streptomyces lannensis TaxID=766498 RepID=UPI0031E99051